MSKESIKTDPETSDVSNPYEYWVSEYRQSYQWPKFLTEHKAESVGIQSDPIPHIDEEIQTMDSSSQETREIVDTTDKKIETIEKTIDRPKSALLASGASISKDRHETSDKKKKPAEILSYGWGNRQTMIPDNYMKTFNVTVPESQVFPSTKLKLQRSKNVKVSKPKGKSKQQDPESTDLDELMSDALRQYKEAKKNLDQMQTRFKTEYQREFVDWSETVQTIQGIQERGAAGLPSDPAKKYIIPNKNNLKPSVTIESTKLPDNVPPEKAHHGKPKSTSSTKKDSSTSPIKEKEISSPTKPTETIQSISKATFLNARNVFEKLSQQDHLEEKLKELPSAGISEHEAQREREKRHYPEPKVELQELWRESSKEELQETQFDTNARLKNPMEPTHTGRILKYNVDPPTTWKLAQDLLNKAHERAKELERDIHVQDITESSS